MLYIFDFNALTWPFSQDIIIHIYNFQLIYYIICLQRFLFSFRQASAQFRVSLFIEMLLRRCRFKAKDEEKRALSLVEHRQIPRTVSHRQWTPDLLQFLFLILISPRNRNFTNISLPFDYPITLCRNTQVRKELEQRWINASLQFNFDLLARFMLHQKSTEQCWLESGKKYF